jgi:tetratricopeptide (TPR) repeat protein
LAALAGLLAVGIACGAAVRVRNRTFSNEVALWTATLAAHPDNPRARNNLGAALVLADRVAEAIPQFDAALATAPDYAPAHRNRGAALVRLSRVAEAIPSLRRALEIDPGDALSHYKLGQGLQAAGDRAGAITAYARAIELQPDLVMAHHNLGIAALELGRRAEARRAFESALQLDADHVGSLNNLAWLLATSPEDELRDAAAAVHAAARAARLTGERDPQILDTLAAAYAEAGDFARAVATLDRVLSMTAADATAPRARLEARRAAYLAGRAYRMGN